MSDARIIGWSDEGWPILHPDDIAAMGDPVDDSLNPGWEEFAERVFGKVEPRQRSSETWLADMKPAVLEGMNTAHTSLSKRDIVAAYIAAGGASGSSDAPGQGELFAVGGHNA